MSYNLLNRGKDERAIKNMRIANILDESIVDGEGWRIVIFFQGCAHNCKGCHNPSTHDFNGGKEISAEELAAVIIDKISNNPVLQGITLSGGDPFYQSSDIVKFLNILKKNREIVERIDIWAYTGFMYEQLLKNSEQLELLKHIDVLVDGEFKEELKSMELDYRGSSNQRLIAVKQSISSGRAINFNEFNEKEGI